jgi:hypothetical protein
MPYPVIVVNSFDTATSGTTLMVATPEDTIEDRSSSRRFYNFNMVIKPQFTYHDLTMVFLTDNASEDVYLLVDRNNKPIIGEQIEMYATNRRGIACQFDSVARTVKIMSYIPCTCYYINQWVAYCSTAGTSTVPEEKVIAGSIPDSTSDTDTNTKTTTSIAMA